MIIPSVGKHRPHISRLRSGLHKAIAQFAIAAGILTVSILSGCSMNDSQHDVTPASTPILTPVEEPTNPATPLETLPVPSTNATNADITNILKLPSELFDVVYHSRGPNGFLRVYGLDLVSGKSFKVAPPDEEQCDYYIQPDAWSPDGRLFVIARFDYANRCTALSSYRGSRSVFTVNINKSSADYLFSFDEGRFWPTSNEEYNRIIWSPNGNLLAFGDFDSVTHKGALKLYDLTRHESSKILEAADNSYIHFEPIGWSPNGKEIFYISNADQKSEDITGAYWNQLGIYRVEISSGISKALYHPKASLLTAIVSPNNPNLVVAWVSNFKGNYYPGDTWNLSLINLSDGEEKLLFDSIKENTHAAFSPDGNLLAYSGSDDAGSTLCFLTLASGKTFCNDLRMISTEQEHIHAFTWLRDSQGIIVQLGAPSKVCGYVIEVSITGELKRTLTSFSPDSENNLDCAVYSMSLRPIVSTP